MLKALCVWAHEKREYNNPCEGAKGERGKGKGDERPQLEISENGRTAILFWVTNVAFLSAALVIVCHTCCHTCGFTMRTTPPLTHPFTPLFPPMLNANAELNPSTRRHNNKKRFTRLNVGKLTTRSVSGFAERHNTHTHTHSYTHTHTPTSTLWHTKATTYPNTLKPKDFYCARYGVLIDTFCIGYFKGLISQTPKYDKLPKL